MYTVPVTFKLFFCVVLQCAICRKTVQIKMRYLQETTSPSHTNHYNLLKQPANPQCIFLDCLTYVTMYYLQEMSASKNLLRVVKLCKLPLNCVKRNASLVIFSFKLVVRMRTGEETLGDYHHDVWPTSCYVWCCLHAVLVKMGPAHAYWWGDTRVIPQGCLHYVWWCLHDVLTQSGTAHAWCSGVRIPSHMDL